MLITTRAVAAFTAALAVASARSGSRQEDRRRVGRTMRRARTRSEHNEGLERRHFIAACVSTTASWEFPGNAEVVRSPSVFAVDGLNLRKLPPSDSWEQHLAGLDVVLLGEHHDSDGDHEMQRLIVERLRSALPSRPLAVGLEMVQQRFQGVLDAFTAGRITENELYVGTEWQKRWSWPFELSTPMFRYCKDNGIRLLALNTDSELLAKVSRGGLEAMSDGDWKRWVPDREGFTSMGGDAGFKTYLKRMIVPSYYMHARMGILSKKLTLSGEKHDEKLSLKRFVSNRLLWDESMAGAAVDFLRSDAGKGGTVCVLAGGDHVKYRYGLRERVERLGRSDDRGLGRSLRVASVMLNPALSDALPQDGPMQVGDKVVQFADYIFLNSDDPRTLV